MDTRFDISKLDDAEKQAFVCMFLARLPKEDTRYKLRVKWWSILEKRFNRKATTYKNDKDAFDAYFDTNNRVGWTDKPLEKRSSLLKSVYDKYAGLDLAVMFEAVKEIIEYYSIDTSNFISMRIAKPDVAHDIIADVKDVITIDGCYTLSEMLTDNRIVFIALGGDKGKSEVDWQTGFYAIAHIVRKPYDIGYQKGSRGQDYYKFDIKVDWKIDTPISKEELIAYPDTYNAPYIGLEIKRDPTQAICQLEDSKAVAIIRAVIDKYPSSVSKFKVLFSDSFMSRVLGSVKVSIPLMVDYGENLKDALENKVQDVVETDDDIVYNNEQENIARVGGGENILFYGVPGCGKSYTIKTLYCDDERYMERVVFHPDYTNSEFIGQILPTNVDGHISYPFVPGPFTRILKKAIKYPGNSYYLIIEEINRGNAPAIFGEVFQLLDRKNGESEYGISNSDIANEIYGDKNKKIKLPSNLSLLATMNTADQNVFTLDTAFKRRWRMKNITNDFSKCDFASKCIRNTNVSWRSFATTINESIIDVVSSNIGSEDTRLGAFFISAEDLDDRKTFAEKVLMYLWSDAFKYDREKIFSSNYKTLEELIIGFVENGYNVFVNSLSFERTNESINSSEQIVVTNKEGTDA